MNKEATRAHITILHWGQAFVTLESQCFGITVYSN